MPRVLVVDDEPKLGRVMQEIVVGWKQKRTRGGTNRRKRHIRSDRTRVSEPGRQKPAVIERCQCWRMNADFSHGGNCDFRLSEHREFTGRQIGRQ